MINNGGGGAPSRLQGDITNDSTNLQTLNFPFQLNADVTANAAAGDITIGGVISEDGTARSLIKSGSNTLSLTGANTYTGTTDINAGRLQLGDGGTTGSLSTSSAIDIASGASFIVNRLTQSPREQISVLLLSRVQELLLIMAPAPSFWIVPTASAPA